MGCLASWPRPRFINDVHDNVLAQRMWAEMMVESATAAFVYVAGGVLRDVVHRMKYRRRPKLCRFMGKVMALEPLPHELLATADILLPVPLSKERQKERGYNQSEMLCEGISSVTGLPIARNALYRDSFGGSQTSMTVEERLQNIKGVFHLKDDSLLRNRHVVLVDDIITTGATCGECLKVLRDIPGIKVSVLSFGCTNR